MNINKTYLLLLLLSFIIPNNETETIFSKINLADSYAEAGLHEDAIFIYEHILEEQTNILGEFNIELINTLYKLSDLHLIINNLKISEEYLKKAINIQHYNILINQKNYLPTLDRLKNIYITNNDSLSINNIDSLSFILSSLEKDSLFFVQDTLKNLPNIISLSTHLVDSTDFVSEYSTNDRALDLIDSALVYLDVGVYSESVKKFDAAIKLNAKIIDFHFLKKIQFIDTLKINNLYIAFNDIEEFDSTITTSNLFLALLGLQKDQNKQIIINNLIKYQNAYPKDIKGYLLLGEIYLRDELFIDAISYYYRALLLDNNNYDANYNLAICLIHLKKYNDAIEKLEFITTNNIDYFNVRYYLGFSHYQLNNYHEAIYEFTQSLLLNSKNDNTYYYLGKSYNMINKNKQALESFIMSTTINPGNGKAHFELGKLYESILKLDKAKAEFKLAKKSINLDELNYHYGHLLYKEDLYSEALSPLREYIINNPNDYKVLEILGDIFFRENRFPEAIDTYTRLLDEYPQNEIFYQQIAHSYLQLKNYKQAKIYYRKLLTFNEENTDVLFILGKISNILNEYFEAEKLFVEAIYCGAMDEDLLFQLGLSYGAQKKYLQALGTFKEAFQFSSGNPILHYQLGVIYYELEIFDLATNEFNFYLETHQNDAVVYRMIGECYYNLFNYKKSTEYLLQATNLYNNQDTQTLYTLALAYKNLKDNRNAAKYFKYIIRINPDHAQTRYQLIDIYQLLNKTREANKECDILYMLDRKLYYSTRFCNS